MHISEASLVAHGIGGLRASINNVPFARGGSPGFVTDSLIAFVNGNDDRWEVATYDLNTGRIEYVESLRGISFTPPTKRALSRSLARSLKGLPANQLYAGGGNFAAWGASFGLYSLSGMRIPAAGLLGVGFEGEVGYKESYQSGGPSLVRDMDGRDWKLTEGHASSLRLFGQRRAIWLEGFNVGVANLPTPNYVNDSGIWAVDAAFAAGEWYLTYYTGAHGIVLHPFGSIEGFSILPKGDGWHRIRSIREEPNVIRCAISTREGEQPGEVWVRDIDVSRNMIRDPWNQNTWAPIARVDVRKINAIDPPPPPPPPPPPEKTMIRDYGEYFARRWNELGIQQQTSDLAARGASEAEFYAVQVPALIRIAGELRHTPRHEGREHPDVGLLFKDWGTFFDAGNGLKIATDIITVKDTNEDGSVHDPRTVAIVDVIFSGGSKESRPSWGVSGLASGSDIDRFREAPAPPEVVDPDLPLPVCDTKYAKDDRDGLCQNCHNPKSLHALKAEEEEEGEAVDLSKLEALATEQRDLLREIRDSNQRIATEVPKALREVGTDLVKAIAAGGLGGGLGGIFKKGQPATKVQTRIEERSLTHARDVETLPVLPEGFDKDK